MIGLQRLKVALLAGLMSLAFCAMRSAVGSTDQVALDQAPPDQSKSTIDPKLPTLFIIGDSTVRNGGKGEEGWGDPIKLLFDYMRINVVNRAMAGRSSRTFRTLPPAA